MENSDKISKLANEMLDESIPHIRKMIERALRSGAIDVEGWDEENKPMILPKTILIAALESEADQYRPTGTSFEKEVNKEVKNIRYFI